MKLTLIRHAQIDEKHLGCYNGHIDIKLSKKGQQQAKLLAQNFSKKKFDAVYSSDLIRAKMTLKQFVQAKDAIYTSELREKSWGKHEGLSYNEIITQNEIKYENFLQWITALDGEPYQEYTKRVKKFFLEFLPQQNKKNVLIMTHAGVIKTLISIIKNISLEEAFKIKIDYASFIVFDYKTKQFKYGDTNENI